LVTDYGDHQHSVLLPVREINRLCALMILAHIICLWSECDLCC